MLAHISYDLPQALTDVDFSAGGAGRISDYQIMNGFLASQTDRVQALVADRYNPLLRWLDRLGSAPLLDRPAA